jgi:hypothetical protein
MVKSAPKVEVDGIDEVAHGADPLVLQDSLSDGGSDGQGLVRVEGADPSRAKAANWLRIFFASCPEVEFSAT